jgi:hypothetical protein
MVVKFLTKLSGCIKKKSTVYEIFRIFRLLVEVPEKAIVPFMVNAFDNVTFIQRLT